MKQYIFGFDAANPERCAEVLAQKGIGAVVTGSADDRAARAFAANGIELYLCYGAHGFSGGRLSVDASGQPRKWFSSGCPNDCETAAAHLEHALDAVNGDVKGVFVDGARFASFASAEGEEAFFTCFCSECMKKLSSEGAREAVMKLQTDRSMTDAPLLKEWLHFRERCVAEYFARFTAKVHALRSDLLACAFVFAPSLAGFVGQTMAACHPLDVVAPMIYRQYPHKDGPACLNHEWAAMKRMFGGETARFAALASDFSDLASRAPEDILRDGFPPSHISREVAAAKTALRDGQCLWPILQIEDPERLNAASAAHNSGADCVGWFMYGQAEL